MKLKKATFYSLLIVGVGLCIGGVFVPPLIAVGAAVLAGAVAVAQTIPQPIDVQLQPAPLIRPESNPILRISPRNQSDESLEIELHIERRRHRRPFQSHQFPVQPDERPEINPDNDEKASPSKRVQKRHP